MGEKETANSNVEAIQEEMEQQEVLEEELEETADEAYEKTLEKAFLQQLLKQRNQAFEEKSKECDEVLNRLQRLQADFDNFRKRSVKEREDFVKYASEKLISELLPVIDNFERALQTDGEGVELKTGVEMIFKQLEEVLAKEGLSQIEAVGSEFDPNQHQAIMQVESEDYPENVIIEEFQKGYRLKDKVIRHSMVKVAK